VLELSGGGSRGRDDLVKILTVRQPWAHAIIRLGKDVENRSRNIAGEYRGLVAIHAAKGQLSISDSLDAGKFIYGLTGFMPLFTLPDGLGAIIGVVDLVDVHSPVTDLTHFDHCQDEAGALCSVWAELRAWHLVLANPRPLAEPIPYRGALGLRELPADVVERILAGVTS